ncbi:hypothetical protein [Pedomonas mirosovicensis]|uniref:hypothetical protein n=1 Tax=Pedomonas mirosovicensis TaxID=2908641 RepID=UPI00216A7C1D|nr:hypothetical protein [Pedomonas mirosovicensis]MCH8685300.1 hypothetical protein [Pedomonas mirosovicensis]
MRLVPLLLFGLLSGATVQAAEPTIADPFSVKEIAVDVVASNATQAREAGIRTAQRRAWRQLWARLTGQAESSAPSLGDGSLDRLVAAVDVISERFSSKRYIARLTVDFDPIPVRATIGEMGIGPQGHKSHPILLLPALKDGGAWLGIDPRNPWFRAWTAFGDVRSAIDYVRVTGTPADAVFLNAKRGVDPSKDLMRLALLRYGAQDFAVAEARLDRSAPGGPVKGTFRILHGLDNEVIGTVELTAERPADVPAMLAEAVTKLDAAMNKALEAGKLKASEMVSAADMVAPNAEEEQTFAMQSAGSIEVLVDTPDAASWSTLEQQLRRAPSLTGLTITGLSLGGVSQVRLGYGSSMEWLHYDLDQLGLRLGLLSDGRWMLRPRQPGETPLPRPVIEETVGEEGIITQEPGAPGQTPQTQPQGQTPQGPAPAPLLPPGFGQQPQNPPQE